MATCSSLVRWANWRSLRIVNSQGRPFPHLRAIEIPWQVRRLPGRSVIIVYFGDRNLQKKVVARPCCLKQWNLIDVDNEDQRIDFLKGLKINLGNVSLTTIQRHI